MTTFSDGILFNIKSKSVWGHVYAHYGAYSYDVSQFQNIGYIYFYTCVRRPYVANHASFQDLGTFLFYKLLHNNKCYKGTKNNTLVDVSAPRFPRPQVIHIGGGECLYRRLGAK